MLSFLERKNNKKKKHTKNKKIVLNEIDFDQCIREFYLKRHTVDLKNKN